MASIQVGAGHGGGGKKAVDADIPLVPFIDLLLCCVMFLLVTAVWNQLATVQAHQQTATPDTPASTPPPPAEPRLVLLVQQSGYVLASEVGDRVDIPKNGDRYDLEALHDRLSERQRIEHRDSLIVAPEDGVAYQQLIRTMDVVNGAGYGELSVEPAGGV